ncbi:ATP-binding protein [Desulfonema limicola]|nr:ATP-binding protein [Desulfonema limicola]
MISDKDRIVVGLSGGMDSLTLMWFLHERLRRIPIDYELLAIYIDPGFENSFSENLKAYCRNMGYKLHVELTDYGVLSHSAYNRENPCFLCSRLRRKRLFELADEFGYYKLALGHNKDDIIETLFLNMFYSGEISTMCPKQFLFKEKFTIIRPLAYAEENMIRKFAKQNNFPEFVNVCPSASISKRREIKDFLSRVYKTDFRIKGNIFRSMTRVKPEYMLNPKT